MHVSRFSGPTGARQNLHSLSLNTVPQLDRPRNSDFQRRNLPKKNVSHRRGPNRRVFRPFESVQQRKKRQILRGGNERFDKMDGRVAG